MNVLAKARSNLTDRMRRESLSMYVSEEVSQAAYMPSKIEVSCKTFRINVFD
jgi:hypothetical protein